MSQRGWRRIRQTPFRSATAVRHSWTRVSGSSTQSTGTSWIRRPDRSARTSSSVSKNQPSSSINGRSARTAGARPALKPHCASRMRVRNTSRSSRLYARRDDLPARPADHAGTTGEARADGDVAVAGNQRGDEGQQRVEVGGEVDIHVGDDLGVALLPRGAEREPPPLAVEVQCPDTRKRRTQLLGDGPRAVGAGVVHHRDAPGEREVVGQVAVEPAHVAGHHVGLVVHRHDDVDLGGAPGGRPHRLGDRCRAHVLPDSVGMIVSVLMQSPSRRGSGRYSS